MTAATLAAASPSWRPGAHCHPAPGAPPASLRWATGEELDVLEALLGGIEDGIREATQSDTLLGIEIEARATRRMLAGEPPVRS